MPYGACGGAYNTATIGCCIPRGTIGYFQGKSTADFECQAINDAYSQCVPVILPPASPPAPPPPPSPPTQPPLPNPPPAVPAPTPPPAMPCQTKAFGGCGGKHLSHTGCCVPAGTTGYDHASGAAVLTAHFECRSWLGRPYSQCLPTVAPSASGETLALAAATPSGVVRGVSVDPSMAKKATSLKARPCQPKTYARCDGGDFAGCCIPSGTVGYKSGVRTEKWSCGQWKDHGYSQCLPEADA